MINLTNEEYSAVCSWIEAVKFSIKHAPNKPISSLFSCGCMGPMPECRCMKRDRLLEDFLSRTPEEL